ncbi:MAG: selenide, water dikinase SelD [Saccharospirillum sp.]|nr:selenide, water dikinase SelD [Saccharospirillum sp.]
MTERDLILVGGGHTHALLIRRLAMSPLPGVRVTLVSEGLLTPYSGMLPGLVAGHYQPEEVHIDLNQLCCWAGVRFIQGRLIGLDPDAQCLHIDGQPELHYDKVSFDTGSTPNLSLPGARRFAVGVKPVSAFYAKWQRLLASADTNEERHWGVVGAGAGGIELVLAMAHRLGDNSPTRLHLVYAGESVLNGYPSRVIKAAEEALARYGVICHPQFKVSAVTEIGLTATNGEALALDQSVLCTSAAAPDWPERAGIETANGGFIAVNAALQSTSHPNIFAAGDVAEMVSDPRPKAGVYAVRQAPWLYDNLSSAFAGKALRPMRLQRRFLSLLSLGGKTAAGHRGALAFQGDWVWRWKDRIDRAFMAKLQDLGPPRMSMKTPQAEAMHCAGCGSKLGPEVLRDALAELPLHYRPEVTPALSQAEDASLWQARPNRVQVQSIDGFRAFSDDLYRLGQVSVHHALSDLYAMGAEPIMAQVWVNLAFAHPRLQQRDFKRLMQGIAAALATQSVTLAGGHSTEGEETHLALTVNGDAEANRLWRKNGAQSGDVLVLTKALGTGVILAADAAAQAPSEAMQAAWQSMLKSNRDVAQTLHSLNPHAVTDVTGFGLLGHLLEMLTDTALVAELTLGKVPTLTGAGVLWTEGWQSSLVPQLEPYLLQCHSEQPLSAAQQGLLLDPQTSGGLLVALTPTEAEALFEAHPEARIIGRFQSREPDQLPVQLSNDQ